jgi:hypothetical protein
MTVAKFIFFAVIVAALLPAGREMLDDLAREVLSAKHQPVSASAEISEAVRVAQGVGRVQSVKNDMHLK